MTPDRHQTVVVLELRPVDRGTSLKAFADVRIGPIVIRGLKVVQQPGKEPWIGLPQVPGRAKADGSGAGWYPIIEIRRPLLDRVSEAVIEAWRENSA
jgi:hypothetical protein